MSGRYGRKQGEEREKSTGIHKEEERKRLTVK